MYLKMTSGPMPTGPPIKYVAREDGRLQPKALHGTSLIAKQCLEYLQREFFPDLQTAYNRGMIINNVYIFNKVYILLIM